jgi:hypothetical protein
VVGQAGRALLLEAAATNLFTDSATKTPSDIWNITGSHVTITYDETVPGPYDPTDTYWNEAHADGVAKFAWSSAVVPSTDYVHTDDVTVSAATYYTASIWVRGFGRVLVNLGAGSGSISTTLKSADVQLSSSWTRVELNGATSGGHNVADIRILPQEQGVCYATGWQMEAASTASALIQTSGGTATRNADAQTFARPLPVESGTISTWFYWPDTLAAESGLAYTLMDATGVSGSERINDLGAGASVYWHTNTATLAAWALQIPRGQWNHIALVWAEDASTDGAIKKELYLQGALISPLGGDVSTAWEPFFGTGFTIATGAGSDRSTNGFLVEELRIDRSAMTALQVADQYDRLVNDDWLHVHRAHAGRKYRIASTSDAWLHPSNPDKILMVLDLEEMDREDDSVVVPA